MRHNGWQYVGYFEAQTYQITKPFIKCYVVHIHHYLPNRACELTEPNLVPHDQRE